MATLKPQSNGPLYSNTVIGTLAVDGWAVTFGIARRAWAGCGPASHLLAVPNVTTYLSTASCTNFILFRYGTVICLQSKGITISLCHTARDTHQLDKVQRRAARVFKRDYRHTDHVCFRTYLSVMTAVVRRTQEKCSSVPVLQGSTWTGSCPRA